MEKEAKVISGKELAWYLVGGTITLGGLSLIVLSLIESIAKSSVLRAADSKLTETLKWSVGSWGSFRVLGLIVFAVGIIVFLASLAYNAKKADRVGEKTQRRASRHGAINLEAIEAANAPQTVDAQPAEAPKAE